MVQYKCKNCSVIFERRKGYGGTGDYCSSKCRREHALPKGESHPNWKGGIAKRPYKIRTIIENKKKQIGKCEECESIDNLEGHHILCWADYPDQRYNPDNIQILCHICHALKHPNIAFTGKATRNKFNNQLYD